MGVHQFALKSTLRPCCRVMPATVGPLSRQAPPGPVHRPAGGGVGHGRPRLRKAVAVAMPVDALHMIKPARAAPFGDRICQAMEPRVT